MSHNAARRAVAGNIPGVAVSADRNHRLAGIIAVIAVITDPADHAAGSEISPTVTIVYHRCTVGAAGNAAVLPLLSDNTAHTGTVAGNRSSIRAAFHHRRGQPDNAADASLRTGDSAGVQFLP